MLPEVEKFAEWLLTHIKGGPDPWGYILGTSGSLCTEAIIKQKRSKYPSRSDSNYYSNARQWLGLMVADCQGMLDAYRTQVLGIKSETNANGNWLNYCKTKSKDITAIPKRVGTAVFMFDGGVADHVGWLCKESSSEWYVVESRGLNYGVVLTKLSDRPWEGWGLMDAIFSYAETSGSTQTVAPVTVQERSLKLTYSLDGNSVNFRTGPGTNYASIEKLNRGDTVVYMGESEDWIQCRYNGETGWASSQYLKRDEYMRGDDVKALQTALNAAGFACGLADGVFGAKTARAVVACQKAKGLVVDGIAGSRTKAALKN